MRKLLPSLCSLLLTLLFTQNTFGQATPAQGDVIFVQADADGEIGEFLTLTRLNLNNLHITDHGICANDLFRTNEGVHDFPSTGLSDVPAGTIVRMRYASGSDNTDASDGLIISFETGPALSASGDQLIVFIGNANGGASCSGGSGTNTYISGITWGNSGATWNSGATSSNNSKAPGTSTDFDGLSSSFDEVRYTGAVVGDVAAITSNSGNGVLNTSNWSGSTSGSTTNFTLKDILFNESDYSAGAMVFTNVTSTGFTINTSALSFSGTNANTRYMVVIRDGSAPDSPVDRYTCYSSISGNIGTAPDVVTSVTSQSATDFCGTPTTGNGKVVYFDYTLPSSLAISGLSASTTYEVRVFAVNGNGYTANYSTTPATGFQATPTEYTWNVASGNWNTSTSWTPSRISPATSDILIFDGNTQATPTVMVDLTETVGEIRLTNGASVTFSGTSTGSPTVDNLILNSGATLTLGANNMSVRETVSGPGTVAATTGTVTLNGSSAQAITGSPSITNLTLNNSNGATISSGTLSISGVYTHTSGELTTNDNLILTASSATSYGQIAGTGSGSINGNVTAQFVIPSSATNGFRGISSPFTGNTVNDLSDDITINYGTPSFIYSSVYSFNEEDGGSGNQGAWQAVSSSTQSMDNEGFVFVIYDADLSSDVTLDLSGTYTAGDYTTPTLSRTGSITDTSGWHLIRNPWPSNFEHSTTITNLVSNTIYIYEGNSVRDWNGAAGSLSNGVVPPFHTMVAQINANGNTLTLPTANRSTSNSANYLDKTSLINYVALKVTDKNNAWDETRLYTNDKALNGEDFWDAAKMLNGVNVPTIYTKVDGFKASINNLNNIPEEGITIPVEFRSSVSGKHTMSFTLENVDPRFDLVLEDRFNNTTHLVANGDYTFNHDPNFNATYHRFNLKFVRKSANSVTEIADENIFIGSNNNNVMVSFIDEGDYSIEVYDLMGRVVSSTSNFQTSNASTKTVTVNNVATGYYIVKVKGENSYKTGKVFLK